MKPVYVPKDPHEKAMQRALIQYRNPKNYELVAEALKRAGRTDLIGFGKQCLIRPKRKEYESFRKEEGRMHSGLRRTSENAGQESGRPKKKKAIRNIHKKKSR